MIEKNKTCQVEMYGNKPCDRQVYDDKGLCICHSEREDKDEELFKSELDGIFANNQAEQFDFTKFIFPKEGWTFAQKHFQKNTHFGNSRFLGVAFFGNACFSDNAHFGEAEFLGEAYFADTLFNGETYFYKTRFMGEVNFGICKFSNETYFVSTYFHEESSFRGCIAKSSALIVFDGLNINENVMWRRSAEFYSLRVDKDAQVIFRKVNMTNVHFIDSDVGSMQFKDVEWPSTGIWQKRRTVADETSDYQNDYFFIAHVYQGLQESYAGTYRYLEAGDFFVGEQEMRRKGRGQWGQYFSLNNAYRILSFYGQSMLLPLFWLLGVILLIPGLLLYGGVGLNLQDKSDIVSYKWSFDISDLIFLKADYWQTFLFNFSFMAFSRSKMHDALTEPWQLALVNFEALVVIGLVAMSLLAVRRRFKRKNF